MNEPTVEAMAARLKNLELECALLKRQARFPRRAGALALVGVALLALAGARRADDKVMDVGGLVVRDKDGKARITLEIANGGPSLRFHDKDGKDKITLEIANGDSALSFQDKAGMLRARMGVGGGPIPNENPYLSLLGVLTEGGVGGIRMRVGDGPFNADEPHMEMSDENDRTRIAIGLDYLPPIKGNPFMSLKDQKGKPLFQAP